MNIGTRDLMVLTKQSDHCHDDFQEEIKWLNLLLNDVEDIQHFCIANELIDVNRYKIITNPKKLHRAVCKRAYKPFVFIFNKN